MRVAGRESHTLIAEIARAPFEFVEELATDAAAAGLSRNVDPAHLGGLRVERLQPATSDGDTVEIRDESDAARRCERGWLDSLRAAECPAGITRSDVLKERLL